MNTLSVEIQNPMKVASDLAQANNYTPPNCPPQGYHGECHMNFLRKMQSSFAWDWGLAAPSAGLWKGVHLEVYNMAMVRDTTVVLELNGRESVWNVGFTVYLESGCAATSPSTRVKGDVVVSIVGVSGARVVKSIDLEPDANGELSVELNLNIAEEAVKLWWPNGYGEQKLYEVNVSFIPHDNRVGRGGRATPGQHSKTIRIGFRTIKLIQKPLGKENI